LTPWRWGPDLMFLGPAWSSGNFFAMAVNSSRTFSAVFADVSKNSRPASLAYCSASAAEIARLSGFSVTKSSLFPARAMMIFSLACRWSSFTHAFALSKDDYANISTRAGNIRG
jgi:hypothetical protein